MFVHCSAVFLSSLSRRRGVMVSDVDLINKVNQHWARFVLGWVTIVFGQVNHLGMVPANYADSAFHPPWVGKMSTGMYCRAKEKAMKLDTIWRSRHIKKALKVPPMKSLVWSVFLYGAESWTIKRSDRDRINSLEMWCWRRLLGISWREHRTNESILDEMGLQKGLMQCCQAEVTRGEGKRGRAFADHTRSSGWNKTPRSTSYVLDPQCAEMEWQDLWGIKSAAQD